MATEPEPPGRTADELRRPIRERIEGMLEQRDRMRRRRRYAAGVLLIGVIGWVVVSTVSSNIRDTGTARIAPLATQSATPSPVTVPPLPDDQTIMGIVGGPFAEPAYECAARQAGPPEVAPGYVGCVARGTYLDLPEVAGKIHVGMLFPPADLTLTDQYPSLVGRPWPADSPVRSTMNWILAPCYYTEWEDDTRLVPTATAAISCSRQPVEAAAVRVMANTELVTVLVQVVADAPADTCADCSTDLVYLQRLARELAEETVRELIG